MQRLAKKENALSSMGNQQSAKRGKAKTVANNSTEAEQWVPETAAKIQAGMRPSNRPVNWDDEIVVMRETEVIRGCVYRQVSRY